MRALARILILGVVGCGRGSAPSSPPPVSDGDGAPIAVATDAGPPADVGGPVDASTPSPEAGVIADASPPPDALPSLIGKALRLKWTESWNQHWADNSGASHRNETSEVTLTLGAESRTRVVDHGNKVDSVLDGDRHEETTTAWTSTWQGSWKRADKKVDLTLDLVPAHSTCVRTETTRRGLAQSAPAKSACALPTARLHLACVETTVDVSPTLPDPPNRKAAAWSCESADDAKSPAVGTRLPWIFGKDGCLVGTGGCPRCGPIRRAPCGR